MMKGELVRKQRKRMKIKEEERKKDEIEVNS